MKRHGVYTSFDTLWPSRRAEFTFKNPFHLTVNHWLRILNKKEEERIWLEAALNNYRYHKRNEGKKKGSLCKQNQINRKPCMNLVKAIARTSRNKYQFTGLFVFHNIIPYTITIKFNSKHSMEPLDLISSRPLCLFVFSLFALKQ